MRIAILGGSFDPPHIGHLLIAQQVKEQLEMDQIWLMPNNEHAFGKKQSSSYKRLEMTKLLEENSIILSDFEIKSKGISYTVDTLNALKKIYPQDEFHWILGSDQLEVFQKYKNWQKIVKNHLLIVFPRESVMHELIQKVKKSLNLKSIPKNIAVMKSEDLILTNISSSLIRKRVKNTQSIKYLVTESIEMYIRRHQLYI